MSEEQVQVLTAHVEGLRRSATPPLLRLLDLWMRVRGRRGSLALTWPAVNLRDLLDQVKAAAWEQQARQRRIANATTMWHLGFWDQEQAARYADPQLLQVARKYDTPPSVPSAGLERLGPVGDS